VRVLAFAVAKTARFCTSSQHIIGVLLTFAPARPLGTLVVVIVASSLKRLFADFAEKRVADAAGLRTISVHPAGIPATFARIRPVRARRVSILAFGVGLSFLTFAIRASALAFVVKEARLLTGRLDARRTLTRAGVHDVDNLLVAEGQMHGFPHGENIGYVIGHDGDSIAHAERPSAILHNGAIVVGDAVVGSVQHSLEVVLHVGPNVLPTYAEVLIAILAALLVVKAYRVAELVQ